MKKIIITAAAIYMAVCVSSCSPVKEEIAESVVSPIVITSEIGATNPPVHTEIENTPQDLLLIQPTTIADEENPIYAKEMPDRYEPSAEEMDSEYILQSEEP